MFGRSAAHVGASGLIFGYFGLLVGRGYYERGLQSIAVAVLVAVRLRRHARGASCRATPGYRGRLTCSVCSPAYCAPAPGWRRLPAALLVDYNESYNEAWPSTSLTGETSTRSWNGWLRASICGVADARRRSSSGR